MQDDAVLLEQYSRMGSAEAFAELAKRYVRMVYGTCLRVTGNPQEAEDITQECFLELARRAGTVKSSLPAWLHKVAKNRALNAISRNATRRQYEEAAIADDCDRAEPGWAELGPIVDEAVDKLPAKLRDLIILHYFQGLTQAEAAAYLGTSQTTVSRDLEKAISSLREQLKNAGVVLAAGMITLLLTENATASVPVSTMAALGKIAASGIGAGCGGETATGVHSTIASPRAFAATSLGRAILVIGVLCVALLAGRSIYAGHNSSKGFKASAMSGRDSSVLQFYSLPNVTWGHSSSDATWSVAVPKSVGEGYTFERRDLGRVVEVYNSAKQPDKVLDKVVCVEQNPAFLTTDDVLPNARANNRPAVLIQLTEHGTKEWSDFQNRQGNRFVGIFANGRLIEVVDWTGVPPQDASGVSGIQLSGFSDAAQAKALAEQINGKMAMKP